MKILNYEMLERSDNPGAFQCVLSFGDEYELSIISGKNAYSTDAAPYEIAVIKHGHLTEMPGVTAEGDTVKGHLTESDVDVIIKKLYAITAQEPVQV